MENIDFDKYPFVKCLNPQRIINPHTGNLMIVGCGQCKACLLNKASRNTMSCMREESITKYNYFITLTYAPEHIPTFVPFFDEVNQITDFYSTCDRFNEFEDDNYLGGLPYNVCSPRTILAVQNKLHDGVFNFPYYRDIQLFLKRLRKQFSKYDKEEKIKFYAVSEYGPLHFRAHWHINIYNNSPKIHKIWNKVVRSCWPYGRIDASLSRGGTSSYVAGYVNSFSTLPRFYREIKSLRPEQHHSRFFGTGFRNRDYDKFYEQDISESLKISLSIGGKIATSWLPTAFQNSMFPRCRKYSSKSFPELLRSYTIYRTAEQEYTDGTTEITVRIVNELINLSGFSDSFRYFSRELDFSKYKYSQIEQRFILTDKERERLFNQVYHDLLVSYHFIYDICHNDDNLFYKRVRYIFDYYNKKEQIKLYEFYTSQSEFLDKNTDKFPVVHFYDNFLDMEYFRGKPVFSVNNPAFKLFCDLDGLIGDEDFFDKINLKRTKSYNEYKQYVHDRYEYKIKHKKLNDENKIFL